MRARRGAGGGLASSSFGLDLRSGDGEDDCGESKRRRRRARVRVVDIHLEDQYSDWWDRAGRPWQLSDVEIDWKCICDTETWVPLESEHAIG